MPSKSFITKVYAAVRDLAFPRNYQRWVASYDSLTRAERQRIREDIAVLSRKPLISLLVPLSRSNGGWVQTIASVQAQLYPHWELCVSADYSLSDRERAELLEVARQDGRVRCVFRKNTASWSAKANSALLLASGEFVVPVDPGDALADHALYHIVKEILAHSDTLLIFSDEDKIDMGGIRSDPWFKSDWNPALMLSCNAFGRLGAYNRALLKELNEEEYELVLRCARTTLRERIRHIPRVLYHRRSHEARAPERSKCEGWERRRRAVTQYFEEMAISGRVVCDHSNGYGIRYETPAPLPRVSILIPTTARPALLEPCLESLLDRSSYDNFEVRLLVNEAQAGLSERADLLKRVTGNPRVRVLAYPDRQFNYSWVSNWGAGQVSGEVLCFLNDDTEVITGDWLEHLVARVLLPGVAAAGPMLYYPNDTIQHAGVILGIGGGVAGHACHREPRGAHGYFGRACLEQDVSCVTAACMTIRADVFNALHGFDETIPLAYNDVDLCIRLRQAGWRIIWTPMAELYHYESASLGRHNSGKRAEQFLRDVALMRQRWGPILDADPFYSRNLSLDRPYKLAFPPR
jgi:GT2 family glycosyltransferase